MVELSANLKGETTVDVSRPRHVPERKSARTKAAKKLKGSEYGLEFGLIVLNFLFKSRALHYGFWEPSDEVAIWNFGKAQENYTQNLLKHVPQDARNILDVGCGTGLIAKRLIDRGHSVECLSPSTTLNTKAREVLPDTTPIHTGKFEEFEIDKTFDLILFAESFQYVKLDKGLSRCRKLLKPGGRILICDSFKRDVPGKSPIGGGHPYKEYLRVRDSLGFQCIQDVDITENIAPTFDLIRDVSLDLLKPIWENLLRVMEINHAIASKVLLWTFRKKVQKIHKHFNPQRNGKSFKEFKTYRIQLLRAV